MENEGRQAIWDMHSGGMFTRFKPISLPVSIFSSVFEKSMPLFFTFCFGGLVMLSSQDFRLDVMNCTCPNGEARTTKTRVGTMP